MKYNGPKHMCSMVKLYENNFVLYGIAWCCVLHLASQGSVIVQAKSSEKVVY